AYALGAMARLNADKPDVVNAAAVALRRSLKDQNESVRRNAVTALGHIGIRDDIALIEPLLQDPHVDTLSYSENGQEKTRRVHTIRDAAKEAIERITERQSVPEPAPVAPASAAPAPTNLPADLWRIRGYR